MSVKLRFLLVLVFSALFVVGCKKTEVSKVESRKLTEAEEALISELKASDAAQPIVDVSDNVLIRYEKDALVDSKGTCWIHIKADHPRWNVKYEVSNNSELGFVEYLYAQSIVAEDGQAFRIKGDNSDVVFNASTPLGGGNYGMRSSEKDSLGLKEMLLLANNITIDYGTYVSRNVPGVLTGNTRTYAVSGFESAYRIAFELCGSK